MEEEEHRDHHQEQHRYQHHYPTVDSAILDNDWKAVQYLMTKKVRVNNPSRVALALVKKGNDFLIDTFISSYSLEEGYVRSLQYPAAYMGRVDIVKKSVDRGGGIVIYDIVAGIVDSSRINDLVVVIGKLTNSERRDRVMMYAMKRAIMMEQMMVVRTLLPLMPPSSYQEIVETAIYQQSSSTTTTSGTTTGTTTMDNLVRYMITNYSHHLTDPNRVAMMLAETDNWDLIDSIIDGDIDYRNIGYTAVRNGDIDGGILFLRRYRIPIDWTLIAELSRSSSLSPSPSPSPH